MKIEMGESLIYSWLRHIKECQIVQTNWKVSPRWSLQHGERLLQLLTDVDTALFLKYGYRIYKNNRSISQILRQGECDALGVSFGEAGRTKFYAAEVAFHESGLNYGGSRADTVMKVLAKCTRTALCLSGYLNAESAEITFASPKINPAECSELAPAIQDVNLELQAHGLNYHIHVLCNEAFEASILQPILQASRDVADTSELFMRGVQMVSMFDAGSQSKREIKERKPVGTQRAIVPKGDKGEAYQALKIGKLADTVLRELLESGRASEEEIGFFQTKSYSKQFFHLDHPLLIKAEGPVHPKHYYARPLVVHSKRYYLCLEWFEGEANNDRPYLLKWICAHST